MKRLIALVCILLGGGCTSSVTPGHLDVRVESFALSDSRLDGTYVLLPSKEAEELPRKEFDEIAEFIEHALNDRGLQKAESQKVADFAVFAHFGAMSRAVTRSRDELILSQQVVMPPVAPAVASIKYEPVGYRTHESTRMEASWFLVLTVYDLGAFRSKSESRVMWEVGSSCDSKGLSIVRAIPAMLSASVERFASSTDPVEVRLVNSGPDKWEVRNTVKLPVISRETKAAQPGATDNPDDAQRLREDH